MDDVERVLALAAELHADPLMRRLRAAYHARRAAEESAVRRAEITRLRRRLAPGHDAEHTKACAGPVSLFDPGDPRRKDCVAHWQQPGRCVCGCGARGRPGGPGRRASTRPRWPPTPWRPSAGGDSRRAGRQRSGVRRMHQAKAGRAAMACGR